ncbi:hypothetical protein GXW82_03285 [Streptacidiphilus sp. 4-A2]|nr:hypothetical protein [Streptacidiphilus sp. 4-A2]
MAALHDDGHTVFVEVSPHPVLTAAISAVLDRPQPVGASSPATSSPGTRLVVGTLRRDQGGAERLLHSLAELQVQGVLVDWARY